MALDIMEIVRDGRKVRFTHYRDGELWYVTETGFAFPVPLSDTAGTTFPAEEKALLFMRWIKAHAKMIETAKSA